MSIMLKSIRLQLTQQMPNYRKPASFLVKESYPLPPYSSVIGMIHSACDFVDYHPLKISIQGNYASELSDLATLYNFGIKFDNTRHQYKVINLKGDYDGVNRGVRSIHLLTDIVLVIHIVPENPEDYDVILNGLLYPKNYLSLGRHEDIARIDSVEFVELEEYDLYGDSTFNYDAYVPIEDIGDQQIGTIYNLNKVFTIEEKTDLRTWKEVIKAKHIPKDSMASISKGYYDCSLNTIVCFA